MLLLVNYLIINLFAFSILVLIYQNVRKRTDGLLFEHKLFLLLVFSNAIILFFDTGMWLINGQRFTLAKEINLFLSTCYYLFNPIPCLLWSYYADYRISRSFQRFRKHLFPLMIPALIHLLLVFANLGGHFMFYIDANNGYNRGALYLEMAIICYFYMLYTFVNIIRNRSTIRSDEFYPMLAFPIPPIIGGVIQALVYGLSMIWIAMSFSLLIIFVNIQGKDLRLDYLTGLFNRRQLDNYLSQRLKNRRSGKVLGGIMMDIDDFKVINDVYGHQVGDQALEIMGNILRNSFRKNDFISRYGGDEFTVIIDSKNQGDLNQTVKRVKDNVERFNQQELAPYELRLSFGYDVYDMNSDMTADQFLKHIDELMYEDKMSKTEKIKIKIMGVSLDLPADS